MKNHTSKNRGIKKINLAEKPEYQGICPSCENLSLCSFIHSQSLHEPVFFCEEFTSKSAPAITKTGKYRETIAGPKPTSEKYKGLCNTCENCSTCDLSKDEAGVWSCEEYR